MIFLLFNPAYTQEILTGQEYLTNLDQYYKIQDGFFDAELQIRKDNFLKKNFYLKMFKKKDELIIHFYDTQRTLISKLFFHKKMNKIILYKYLSGKFYQIEQEERLDNFLGTSFSYIDFSFPSFEENFSAESKTETNDDHGEKAEVLSLKAISYPNYPRIDYKYSSSKIPIRLDFFNYKGILIKTMKFKSGKLKKRKDKELTEINYSAKEIYSIDINTNIYSILILKEWNEEIVPNEFFFEWRNLLEN
jgi:hypothetical protein